MGNENTSLKSAIKHVVNYYAYFDYAPSLDELHLFLSIKTTKQILTKILQESIKNGEIITKNGRYALQGHRIFIEKYDGKKEISEHKMGSISLYLSVVSKFSVIQLVGLSGSIAMRDADPDDDIDLFIITKKSRMWTARFLCFFTAMILGLRRKRNQKKAANKVCLNLFFDERELLVPSYKRNEYTAHEVIQMKPLINKNHTYETFLRANNWVKDYFPNVSSSSLRARCGNLNFDLGIASPALKSRIAMTIGETIEIFLKIFQLFFINRHKTTEIITSTQLWFYPQDFEKKLKLKKLI